MSILLLLFSNCKKTPSCNEENVPETVLEIIFSEKIDSNNSDIQWFNGYNDSSAKNASKEVKEILAASYEGAKLNAETSAEENEIIKNAELINIIKIEENKDLNSCGCEATLKIDRSIKSVFLGNQYYYVKKNSKIIYQIKTDVEGNRIIELVSIE